jgi:hypothetical protein
MVYEKILLLLFLIIFIIAIYYISKTCYKHNSILEKFSEKQLYKNAKFRDCQVYFTKNKEKCDEDYKSDNNNTCKYKFKDWKELDEIKDSNNNVYKYANKVYVDNKLNESDYKNVLEETRCFYKLGDEDDKSGDNVTTIDSIAYKYQDFYPFSIESSICGVTYPTKTELKGKKFYEFVLDNNNNIVNINKVDILPGQNGFKVDDSFSIEKFVEKYGNGLEYKSNNEFNIYQVSKFPDINVKVHKFTYNYLCYNTQIINYNIITTKINIGNIINLQNNSVIVRPTNNGNNIDTNISGINWNNFKNSNPNLREDKRQSIINALIARKNVLQDELKNKNKETAIILAKIKENIVDNGVANKYQFTKYIDTNSSLWNQDNFLNKFNVFNYKRQYLTKSANAPIDYTNVEVSIRIKNNFKEGLKYIKVDGYYNNNAYAGDNYRYIKSKIEHIRNKEFINELHQDSGENITNFRGLYNLTSGKQNPNVDHTYTMWFSGYFYAHETGNYKFGTRSDDASHIFINDELVVDNGGNHGMRTVEQNYGTIKKGDICKLDIYFGENGGGDNLEIFWKLNNSNNIYSSEWNNKTWIYHTDPDVNPTNHSSKIPTMKGNKQYVDGREHKLSYKTAQDNSGDIYYEFKNTDFIYEVIVNRDVDARVLVIGGGGGGGMDMGGGGGAGGYIEDNNLSLKKDNKLTIRVGKGGNGAPEGGTSQQGNYHQFKLKAKNGENTVVKLNNQEKYKALGGGYGGSSYYYYTPGINGGDGGSGGGSGGYFSSANYGKSGKTSDSSQGNDGKNQYDVYTAGGGGGAGKPSYGSDGGKGKSSNITGKYIYFAGGGGGSGYRYKGGNGGDGGGGGGACGQTKGGIGYNTGENGGGVYTNRWTYIPGGRGGDNTGGGGGGGSHCSQNYRYNRGGRGGSGIVILRIANSPVNKLAKCNYYIPPLSEITSYLEKSDVLESKINFEVRNAANPKSLFYSSYIYLKKGYYKFNFDIDTSSHNDLFMKSKIIIYDNKEKTNFISVFKDNMVTKKWVYIPATNYYIFDISIVYISENSNSIPFKIKARYTNEEKSNKLDFSSTELNINNYEAVTDANKFKDMSYYIYYHDKDYLSGIKDITDQYNKDFNRFLESYYLLNNSFGYVINYFKLLGKTNNEIKSDRNIQKIDKLLEYLNNIDLRKYLDSSGESKLIENNLINNIFAENTIININDYITFNQYRQEDKNKLKGADNKFNMFSHGPRSLYIEIF